MRREADVNFVNAIVDAEGPVIFAIGFNQAYMREVLHEVADRIPVKRRLLSSLQLDLEDGREIIFRSVEGAWMRGRRVNNIIEHEEVVDFVSPHKYEMMHEALTPCQI